MKTLALLSAAAVIAATGAAHAGGNSDNAKAMAKNIQALGNGSIASTVSGNKNPVEPSFSGWGNVGSTVTGDPESALFQGNEGGQVAKSGKRK